MGHDRTGRGADRRLNREILAQTTRETQGRSFLCSDGKRRNFAGLENRIISEFFYSLNVPHNRLPTKRSEAGSPS